MFRINKDLIYVSLLQISIVPHCTYHSYSAYLIYSKCSDERSGDHSQLPQKILQENLSAVVTCIKVHFTASFFVSESSVSEKNNKYFIFNYFPK